MALTATGVSFQDTWSMYPAEGMGNGLDAIISRGPSFQSPYNPNIPENCLFSMV